MLLSHPVSPSHCPPSPFPSRRRQHILSCIRQALGRSSRRSDSRRVQWRAVGHLSRKPVLQVLSGLRAVRFVSTDGYRDVTARLIHRCTVC